MKKLIILIGGLTLFSLMVFALFYRASLPEKSNSFDGNRAYEDIKHQVSLGPRTTGSPAQEKFIDWLGGELNKSGWRYTIQQAEMMEHPIKNIVAQRGEGTPEILIVAHYDSRLNADHDPDPANHSLPVPGANDGASGVAILLELSRVLPENTVPVGLVFLDAEDNGRIPGWDWILGSRAYVASLDFKPRAVVLVDMVGDANLNIYKEKFSDPGLVEEIWEVARILGHEEYFINEYKHQILDDHVPFLEAGIPAVDIIDIEYPYYHTLQDTVDKVSPESLQIVGDTVFQWILLQK